MKAKKNDLRCWLLGIAFCAGDLMTQQALNPHELHADFRSFSELDGWAVWSLQTILKLMQ